MLGENSKVDSEKKEKKLSWSIVFAWLYLHTFGKILPKKWNKWAENIIEPYEVTNSDDVTEPGGDKDVTFGSQLQTVTHATQTEDPVNLSAKLQKVTHATQTDHVNLSPEPLDEGYGTAPSNNGSETDLSHDGSEEPEYYYDNELELPETEDPEDAVLYARMEILLAELAESNEKYLRHTINEQEKEIAQLKWEIEIAEEALRNTTLKVVKLMEENEQPKHNPTEINALNTRNTTEGTPEKPSTSVTNVEENGYHASLLQSFS